MDVKIINPFIESTTNVLKTMAYMDCAPGKLTLKEKGDLVARGFVTGVIEISDSQVKGSLAVSFSREAILSIAEKMLGQIMDDPQEMASDLAGELTNIIAGGAKKILAEKGYNFGMAIPKIVCGEGQEINHNVDAPVLILPFGTDSGQFYIEVSFKQEKP